MRTVLEFEGERHNLGGKPLKLTRTQIDALVRIRDRGPYAWCPGGRAGGATSRMFERMAEIGLCSLPPIEITTLGRKILTARGV